jgi:Xaa-Pro aminopeptidase
MKREIEEKTDRLVRMLSEEDLGGVLINSQPNFAWLTAGGTNGVDSSRENGVATLFVRNDGKRFLLANKIEVARIMTEELVGQDYEVVDFAWEDEKANPALVAELAQSLGSGNLTLGSDLALGASVRVIEGALARTRYQLTDAELERYRALGAEAGEAIGRMARALVPGLTESEVARRANDALAEIGARAVVNLVAGDERLATYRHPVPKDHAWRSVLMVVVCARRAGLIASLTRIVCAGKSSEDLSRRTQASASVNAQLFAATRRGMAGSELYEVAARAYREAGFAGEEKLHHQGGATGYRTRDWVAHPHCGERVQERQAFAWNPSITGSKVEETCIAFADGIEIVTATPGWPMISVEAGGREYLLPDVLVL